LIEGPCPESPERDHGTACRAAQRLFPFHAPALILRDRESEVSCLPVQVGIKETYAAQSPEQKLELVRRETERVSTVFFGDGSNNAPALTAATVGVAFGSNSDITAEAAGAVILDTSLRKVDELLHVSRRLRLIALQSAVGGMALSLVGMALAAAGYLPPVAGAMLQEGPDALAVVNGLGVALPPRTLTGYGER
jgi:cation transport ATPase